jgi:hypothetical protein
LLAETQLAVALLAADPAKQMSDLTEAALPLSLLGELAENGPDLLSCLPLPGNLVRELTENDPDLLIGGTLRCDLIRKLVHGRADLLARDALRGRVLGELPKNGCYLLAAALLAEKSLLSDLATQGMADARDARIEALPTKRGIARDAAKRVTEEALLPEIVTAERLAALLAVSAHESAEHVLGAELRRSCAHHWGRQGLCEILSIVSVGRYVWHWNPPYA